jgi:hypothetical protein
MAGLLELRVVEEVTGGRRNRLFRYSPYLSLFTSEPSPSGRTATPQVTNSA